VKERGEEGCPAAKEEPRKKVIRMESDVVGGCGCMQGLSQPVTQLGISHENTSGEGVRAFQATLLRNAVVKKISCPCYVCGAQCTSQHTSNFFLPASLLPA
jgi:hypothetical protein